MASATTSKNNTDFFIGVDVGSGSVRAGLFNTTGALLAVSVKPIQIHNPEAEYFEQSSSDIWASVVTTIKSITQDLPETARPNIKGLAFCSTCSLVAVGPTGAPVSMSKGGDPQWDIIMWMDHRASAQAEFINSTRHHVLAYVGGKISLEMQTPKLLWLKQNLESSFKATSQYFDLGDWLHWKATGGKLERSICCITCKWTYVNQPKGAGGGWDESYFREIGLIDGDDAVDGVGGDNILDKITTDSYSYPGDSRQICPTIAKELGLGPATQVGFSMIDAHSGVLGMIGCKSPHGGSGKSFLDVSKRLAIICGTSNCHMALSKSCLSIPGVWGPYFGVILPDFYLSEGGQSAAGSLLDHVVKSHVAYGELLAECEGNHGKVLAKLESLLNEMNIQDTKVFCELTRDLHIWPDFHGNRSPIADPSLKGMISGLTLSVSRQNLATLYLATIQALAYASRHIKEAMESAGHSFAELVLCGGLVKSKLFLQLHADIIRLPVVVPASPEPVLLGAAMSARAACETSSQNKNAGGGGRLEAIVNEMAGGCETILYPNPQVEQFHAKKYKVFLTLFNDQLIYRKIMG